MYKVDGNTITMTRGDTVAILVSMTRNGEQYIPQYGDVIRFAVKNAAFNRGQTAYIDPEPIIRKIIPNDSLILRLDPEDTKSLPFAEYAYDIEITFANGEVDTFIAEARLIIAPEVD